MNLTSETRRQMRLIGLLRALHGFSHIEACDYLRMFGSKTEH